MYLVVIGNILLVQLASRGLSSVRNWTLVIAGNKVVHRLRGIVFDKIQRLPSLLPQVKMINKRVKYIDLRWDSNYIKLDE